MEESRSRKVESGLSSSSSTAKQSSTDKQKSKEQLSKVLYQGALKFIESIRVRIMDSLVSARNMASVSSIASSSIPIVSFIFTPKTKSIMNTELSTLFEDMNVEVMKGATYDPPYDEIPAIDILQKESINSLNEIEKIIAEEYHKNEKGSNDLTKELCMVMVFLPSMFSMMQIKNSYGVNDRRAFLERHVLDRCMQKLENKLESFLRPNTVLDKKEDSAFLKEFLPSSEEYAIERHKAFVCNIRKYFKKKAGADQCYKFIKEDEAKAKNGSRSRLPLDNVDERKLAMHGIISRLEGLKRDIEDECNSGYMIFFYNKIIRSSLPILSYIIRIPYISQHQATMEGMKNELSNLFEKMRQNLVTAIEITAICSISTRRSWVKEWKDRIRACIKLMEMSICEVANDGNKEEGECLMLLYSIANVFLPSIEWIAMYARHYDGSGNFSELEGHLRDKEEEFKAGLENLIMNTGHSSVWPNRS